MRADDSLARFLYRPIVFREPDRVVHPPSWLEHIPFAFWLVDVLRPDVLVELGTASGDSYAAFAQAVQMLGLSTACYAVDTWRGDPQAGFYDEGVFTEWASYHDRHFAAFSRLIRSTFEEAVQHFADGSIDLLHIDGLHTYEAVSADFERWRPKLSRRGVILLHDINVRERDFGAWRLWEELKARSPSFEFLHGHGLGIVAAGPDMPEALQWLFSRSSVCPDDVGAVREFFARLGGGISARFEIAGSSVRAELLEQTATVSRLTGELTTALAELDARGRRQAQADLRIARLEDELARRDTAHGRDMRLAAELHGRIAAESERRQQLEAERDLLHAEAAARSAPFIRRVTAAPKRWAARILASGWRRRARHVKAVSTLLGRSLPRFVAHPARLREAYAVAESGLFDEAYYRRRYPDVATSRLTPLAHFLLEGAREGRNPHALFDSAYYLHRNADVAAGRTNPLIHYLTHGRFESRNPHPLFDVAYYLNASPDVKTTGIDPLKHFLNLGAAEGRDPGPFFDSSYYLRLYPDVGEQGMNPLRHFVLDGWREGRRPSPAFDTQYYLSENSDVRRLDINPLVHYLEHGLAEGRKPIADQDAGGASRAEAAPQLPEIRLRAEALVPARVERPTVICVSHVMPWPPRAGNEYRIYRMLRWLRDQGYRVIPVIAPLPGERVTTDAVRGLAEEFSNAVLCDRDGRLQYVLRDAPDVLASLAGEFARPFSVLLDEGAAQDSRERQLLEMDSAFCHDALITTVLRLQQATGPCVLLAEYIWMSRLLPLVSGDVLKVIDTIDVFSTKKEKVLNFGIDDVHVEAHEEAKRLQHADLVLAIHDDERRELQRLAPGKHVVTAGVDLDVVEDGGIPSGRQVLYVGSDNPMNMKGLSDFLRFAWPQIRRDVPDAELVLAGRVSGKLDADVAGVIRLGLVDDLAQLYRQARVVINPAVAGTGLKIKTLEALGHLRPIVTWPGGTDGLAPELAAFCLTVQDWPAFSRRVAGLLAADKPTIFSRAERDVIARLTSPATVYRAMTEAMAARRP